MSSDNLNTQQFCSRIFRPWDKTVKTNQDCTITSTTNNTNNEEISLLENKISDTSEKSDLNSKVKLELNGILDTSMNIGYNFQHINYPYIEYDQTPQLSMYNKSSNFVQPYIGSDNFCMGSMEQEYVRVITQEAQAKMNSMRKQRPKKFKCPQCNVAFSNNGQLKGHIRIHTGERPFKCEETNCGKTFTRNEELTRHKRIHTGVRPFACMTCGKRFGRRDHLKKHTKTHFVQERYLAPAVFLPVCSYLYGF